VQVRAGRIDDDFVTAGDDEVWQYGEFALWLADAHLKPLTAVANLAS
jgi:hypothetical protein